MTICLVQLHFGSRPLAPSFGFMWTLTISPALISGYVLLLFALFWRCQLTHKWFSLLPASVGLIWVTLCSVEFYLLIMLSICLIQLVLSCFKESNLLYNLSLNVLIHLSTVWAWVISCLNSIDFSFVNGLVHCCRPHRRSFIWI